MSDPWFQQMFADAVVDELLQRHPARALLLVTHPVITSIYLATLLGLSDAPRRMRHLGRRPRRRGTSVTTLNAAFHLQGVAA